MKKFITKHGDVTFICHVEVNGDVSKIQVTRNAGSKVSEIRNFTNTDDSFIDMLRSFTTYLDEETKGKTVNERGKYLEYLGALNSIYYGFAKSKYFETSYGCGNYINTGRLYVDGNGVAFRITLSHMDILHGNEENHNSVVTYYEDDCPFKSEVLLLLNQLYKTDKDELDKLIKFLSLSEREKYFDVYYVPRK